jgi:hypothetical protein
MKRKISIGVTVVFLAVLTTVSLSPRTGHSFWFGTDIPIPEKLSNEKSQELHDYLVQDIIPPLLYPPAIDVTNNPDGTVGVIINKSHKTNNPDGIKGVRHHHSSKTWPGYTLLNCFGGMPGPNPWFPGDNAILIDMEGNVLKSWNFVMMGLPAKMLPNGDVIGGGSAPGVWSEGWVTQLSWEGDVIKQWGKQHHDSQRQGNPVGYYAPGMDAMTDSGITMWLDRECVASAPEISTFGLEDDVIHQADWEGNIIWEWRAREHFKQNGGDLGLGFDANGEWAIMNVRNNATIQCGFVWPPPPVPILYTDWTHVNSVSWLGPNPWFDNVRGGKDCHSHHGGDKVTDEKDYRFHPENLIIDYRAMNIIAIIARYDHPEGKWLSGDIVWRVGPDYSADKPEGNIGQIIGQHMAHMIPKTLPGGGNILVFDNGGMAGFGSLFRGMKDATGGPIGTYPNTLRDYSRIIEFNPVTLKIVWQYIQPKPTYDYDGDGFTRGNERKFFAAYYSGAQRLHNGNTLITEGNTGRVFEVTREGEIVWEYINEHDAGMFGNMLYRAYRVPKSWVENAMNGQ